MLGISGISVGPRNPITQALPALRTSPTAQHRSARRVRACPVGPRRPVARHLLTWPRQWYRRTSVPGKQRCMFGPNSSTGSKKSYVGAMLEPIFGYSTYFGAVSLDSTPESNNCQGFLSRMGHLRKNDKTSKACMQREKLKYTLEV